MLNFFHFAGGYPYLFKCNFLKTCYFVSFASLYGFFKLRLGKQSPGQVLLTATLQDEDMPIDTCNFQRISVGRLNGFYNFYSKLKLVAFSS